MQLIPAAVLPSLLDMASRGRVNMPQLLEQLGIDHELVGRDDRYITLRQLDSLMTEAFACSPSELFGLEVGSTSHPAQMGLLGQLLSSAASLREAITCLLEFKDLMAPYLHFELQEQGPLARVSVLPDDSVRFATTRAHNDLITASMVAMARSLLGGDIGLLGVSLRHAQPAWNESYLAHYGCQPNFSCVANAVSVRREVLDVPLPGAYPKYHQRLRANAEVQLRRLQSAQGVSGKVRDLLMAALTDSQSTAIEVVAATLHLTPRTLQRRLAQEGITFAQLRDQLRQRLACRALLETDVDLAQLAMQLGFTEVSNFSHAFRRWQGVSPSVYRRRHRPNS